MIGEPNRDRHVDADHADIDAAGEVAGGIAIAGVDRDAIAVFVLPRQVERFFVVLRADDGKDRPDDLGLVDVHRSDEHTSELQSLMRTSYAVFCLKEPTKQPIRKTPKQSVGSPDTG